MADTTRSDVDDIYGDRALSDSEADALVAMANRAVDNNFGGLMRTLSEVEGNEKDAKTLLAAHYWEIAEGGEVQSMTQQGGSVNYSLGNADEMGLADTRFGRLFKSVYVRSTASISVEIGRRR